jgi:uncharacterized protein (DUF2141 family)
MRLAWNYIIIGILSVFLFGCAQLGTIEGGEKDAFAPKIIKSSVNNGAVNFKAQPIEWMMDEYFQVNNPQTTVSLSPAHARLKTSYSGKKFRIDFLDSLKPNTTYQILLNGTLKDINEGNDSLMVFVFSTGSTLDSSFFQASVEDAFSKQPSKKIFVGLYDTLGKEPLYLQKTNDKGAVSFSYIKTGDYSVFGWEDQNNNGKFDTIERICLKQEKFRIQDTIIDSIPLRLAKSENNRVVRSSSFIDPGLIGIGLNDYNESYSFIFSDNQEISKEQVYQIRKDSLLISYLVKNGSKLYVKKDNLILDSVKFISIDEPLKSLKVKSVSTWFKSDNPIVFETTDFIKSANIDKFIFIDKSSKDTVKIDKIEWKGNLLMIYLQKNTAKELEVLFEKEAIEGRSSLKSEKLRISLTTFLDRELGVLIVNVDKLNLDDIVELIANNKVVESQKKGQNKELVFKNLVPSDYTFRVIRDINNNGRWDGWNVEKSESPENVFYFGEPVKVRANWEIKTELVPKK